MAWTSLSTRLGSSTMPQVLAGPMLRKVDPLSVTVWFALKSSAVAKLTVTDTTGQVMLTGQRATCAVGNNLHIVAVTADTLAPFKTGLSEGVTYLYDVTFDFPTATPPVTGMSLAAATRNASLTYAPHAKPSFCMPPLDINKVRLIHGSCRKPSGDGPDALALVDTLIEQKATLPFERPQQLLLTGDQIYADDVAASMLVMLTDAAKVLLWDEVLPTSPALPASILVPYSRRKILDAAGFSSEDLDSHLMSLGEYLSMYLFVWSDVLWPVNDADVPDVDTVMTLIAAFVPNPPLNPGDDNVPADDLAAFRRYMAVRVGVDADRSRLLSFRSSLVNVRRVLANIPSYMIFDDHEVTDDWNMTLDRATAMYGTLLGRRVIQNALVAFSLCQAWGNTPEQFSASPPSEPGPSLLLMLNNQTGTKYEDNSLPICSIVSVHTADEVRQNGAVFHDTHALKYNYTVEGLSHQVIVTDSRTFRSYPRGGGAAPDLLPLAQFAAQITNAQPPLNNRTQIVVLSTNAPPIEPIRSATEHDRIANAFAHWPDIHEAWDIPSMALDRLAKALSDRVPFNPSGRSGKVILLSGDVHIGFAARLHYRALKRFEDTGSQHANLVIAQLVASSFKKQTDDTIDLQRQGYTYAPHWYAHPMIPDHETEYYVGWNVKPTGQNMGNWTGRSLDLDAASSVQLKRPRKRVAGGGKVDTPPSFIRTPPDFSYQLDYLAMASGGIAPKAVTPLPPLPAGGATKEEREESAHIHRLASVNYRQHNRDPGVIRHLIGVNNFGDLTFSFAPERAWIVNHRLRFRSPEGEFLFVDYAVNMEVADPDHPTDASYMQVSP